MQEDHLVQAAWAITLKSLRGWARISQRDLAAATKLNRPYISKMERGMALPSLHTMLKLSRGLGISLANLSRELEENYKDMGEKAQDFASQSGADGIRAYKRPHIIKNRE